MTLGIDGLAITGTMAVTEQGQSLKATASSAEVSSIPNFSKEGSRSVTVDYTLPSGSKQKIEVSVSTDGLLTISVPQAVKDTFDERHIVLIGISIAKERLGVSVESLKGILVDVV